MSSLTVVVPSFNGSSFLATTLTSLQLQQDVDLEIVVVDDGSTDDSAAIANAHPCQARVIEQPNLGVAVARNRGLAEARGDWVAFLDQDDIWHPRRARVLLDLAQRTGAAVVGTTEHPFARESDRGALTALGDGREAWPATWVVEDDLIELSAVDPDRSGSDVVEYLDQERFLNGPASVTTSFMFDRVTAISAGGCAPHARALDDHVFYVNLSRIVGPFARLNRAYLYYRVHSGSATTFSPLAEPFLTTLLALRAGRVHPARARTSAYLDHLRYQVADGSWGWAEQLALLTLTTAPGDRAAWLRRWGRRRLRRLLSAGGW